MQINEKLNIVIPLRRDEAGNTLIWGYHTPISHEVFEVNFRVLAATKAALFAKGKSYAAQVGPQIASLLLRDEAKRDAADRQDAFSDDALADTGAAALLNDLKRLTLVMAPGAGGWEQVPVDVAIARNVIDVEDWREAEAGLVFFTCLYSICRRSEKRRTGEGLAEVLGGSITSSSPTEYAVFLQTSMTQDTTQKAE